MTDNKQIIERDEVLYAFHVECSRPTLEDIGKWISKYPQFADDIRTHAAIARDWDACKEEEFSEAPDQVMLARGYSDALNVLYEAKLRLSEASPSASETFQQLMAACGKDVPALARQIGGDKGIARSVLADLVNGAMQPPIGERFRTAVTGALSTTLEKFDGALQLALRSPRLGHAKATVVPTIHPRPYQDIVKDSGMNPEQIRYWLDED